VAQIAAGNDVTVSIGTPCRLSLCSPSNAGRSTSVLLGFLAISSGGRSALRSPVGLRRWARPRNAPVFRKAERPPRLIGAKPRQADACRPAF